MTKRKNTYFLTLLILTIQLSEQCSKNEKEIHGGVRMVYSVVAKGHASADLSAPILVLWVPCPHFPL